MLDIQNKVLDISNNYYNYLMSLKNVNGVGFGYKHINGVNTFKPCIHVLVENKIDKKYISLNNVIPNTYMGIMTDVIEVGKIKSRKDAITEKCRPLSSGYSISCGGSQGSIACIVSKRKLFLRDYFILSNNHVLADCNKNQIGAPVFQPSLIYDKVNYKDNIVAELDTFINIKFIEGDIKPENFMDCAIARIIDKNNVSNKLYPSNSISGIGEFILVDLFVKKTGKSSGLTSGRILTIGTSVDVDFEISSGKIKSAFFKNQIVADLKNESGDSGCAILNQSDEIIGLFFSGSDTKAIFTDINIVLKKLNVNLFKG